MKPNSNLIRIGRARTLLVALILLAVLGAQSQAPQTVQVTVDYNDGVQKQIVLPFKNGMTVFDAMTAAQNNPHAFTFRYNGTGGPPKNYFLTQIDDVRNQGGGTSAKNWVFWVNKVFSDQGFGVCKIGAGDQIVWKFDVFHGQQPGKACR